MKTLYVLVPKLDTRPAHAILPKSGIVAATLDDQVDVYFEGNRYGAANIVTFEDKVLHAAGRLDAKYPTVARGRYALDDFVVVGLFSYSADWKQTELEVFESGKDALEAWQR